jgi:TolB-like protein
LGEDAQQIIKTVPRRGYIFDAEVKLNHSNARELVYQDEVERVTVTEEENEPQPQTAPHRHRRWVASLTAVVLALVALAGVIWWLRPKRSEPSSRITTLAVLPFRSQVPSSQDDYLGLGMANEIITKISQSGSMTVRPTSAVRKYTTADIDALQAARELQADAVLDGTYLRVGDRLRITVNLLRVSDGASLWAEKFDQEFTDIFGIQDRVSQQVAQRLWSKLSPAQHARLDKRPTSNPLALSYYAKRMYHFYNIGPNSSSRSDAQFTYRPRR